MDKSSRRPKWTTVFLVVLPVWLIVSAIAGLFLFFRHEKKAELEQQARFAQVISIPSLADDLKKLVEVIGERNTSSETAARNLDRAASMIEGLLGPANTGYQVKRHKGPAGFPIIEAKLPGRDSKAPVVWVVATYDSPQHSRGGEANASGAAALIGAGRALADDRPASDVRFVFLPHFNDRNSPVMETLATFREFVKVAPTPKAVLCVEAMGGGEPLWLTSRDTSADPLGRVESLGMVVGAEVACLGEDSDLASVLIELGIPATRVSTRAILTPGEADDRLPFPPTVAASAGRLAELIRRCSK